MILALLPTMVLLIVFEDCVHCSGIVKRREDDEMIAHLMDKDGTTTHASVNSSSIVVQ